MIFHIGIEAWKIGELLRTIKTKLQVPAFITYVDI